MLIPVHLPGWALDGEVEQVLKSSPKTFVVTTVIVVNIMYVGFSSRNEFPPGLVWVRFILLFYLISSHISQLFFPVKLSPVL